MVVTPNTSGHKSAQVIALDYRSFASPIKERELLLLYAQTDDADGADMTHVFRSVTHTSAVESKHRRRTHLGASAVRLRNTDANECEMTIVLSCDADSVLMIASDLLGETRAFNDIAQRINDIVMRNQATTTHQ